MSLERRGEAMSKIHPREARCNTAERILREAVRQIYDLDLTQWEHMLIINRVLSDEIAGVTKFAIRYDRHGNTEDPGGLA